jgi:flagellar basal-body rod protein FlgC
MPIKPLFSSLEISATGLTANRRWMDAIAENLANAQTTRTPEGGPYRRKMVTFSEAMKLALPQKKLPDPELDLVTTDLGQEPSLSIGRKRPGPYSAGGVESAVTQEDGEPRMVYDPEHPDADQDGYVAFPNIEPVKEMVDMITASRSYEANVTAMNTAKAMNKKALEI